MHDLNKHAKQLVEEESYTDEQRKGGEQHNANVLVCDPTHCLGWLVVYLASVALGRSSGRAAGQSYRRAVRYRGP